MHFFHLPSIKEEAAGKKTYSGVSIKYPASEKGALGEKRNADGVSDCGKVCSGKNIRLLCGLLGETPFNAIIKHRQYKL